MIDDADPATTIIILHMFDNSVFLGDMEGNLAVPVKIDGHMLGRLEVANAKTVKKLFEAAMQIMRAATASQGGRALNYWSSPSFPSEKMLW